METSKLKCVSLIYFLFLKIKIQLNEQYCKLLLAHSIEKKKTFKMSNSTQMIKKSEKLFLNKN